MLDSSIILPLVAKKKTSIIVQFLNQLYKSSAHLSFAKNFSPLACVVSEMLVFVVINHLQQKGNMHHC